MTQQILIKPEVTAPVAKPVASNKALSSEDAELQPFSSELNKQIDKHDKTQQNEPEKVDKSDKTTAANKQDKKAKAEKVDSDDGKKLPKESSEPSDVSKQDETKPTEGEQGDDKVITIETESVVENVVSVVLVDADKNRTDEVVSDEESTSKAAKVKTDVTKNSQLLTSEQVKANTSQPLQNTSKSAPVSPSDANEANKDSTLKQTVLTTKQSGEVNTHIKEGAGSADDKVAAKKPVVEVVQQILKPQQIEAVAKSANIQRAEILAAATGVPQKVVDGVASDLKKQATELRPDILYGINKKYSAEGTKAELPAATVEMKTADRMVSKAISEGQLMADVVKQVKPGLQQAAQVAERAGPALGSLVTAHTPAATVSQGQATTATTSATPVLDIQPAIQTAAWNRVMSGRVVWMAREGVQHAELKLNPASLGPVEVRLNMNNEQASVTFIANHAATRDALEQALPRLRESFTENGMELTDAEVSQHSSEEQNQDDAAETEGSTTQSSHVSVDGEEFSDEQQNIDEQKELDVGVSLYA